MPVLRWVLYGTAGCHLCHEAAVLLREFSSRYPGTVEWREVDIAGDEALTERYGIRIPVLRAEEGEAELGWPFDFEQMEWLHRGCGSGRRAAMSGFAVFEAISSLFADHEEYPMALSSKGLQKKRAKKSEKRRKAKPAGSGIAAMFGFAQEWAAAARAPVADVLVPETIFESGIGTLWFTRKLPDGRHAVAGFVVDTYCLGVKNALYKIADAEEYAGMMNRIESSPHERFQREHPAYARKLVEQAVEYARNLGFEPHVDYKIAKTLFGDVDAGTCPTPFAFGKAGKPFYVCGPNDSPAMQRKIVKQMERRCGPGGYDFFVMAEPD